VPVVEVDFEHMGDNEPKGRPRGRVWLVRMRSGQREVVVAEGLGRPSADYLARQIAELLNTEADAATESTALRVTHRKPARTAGMN
jgi:hypothetical protein